jgi:hypothetical protein
MGYVTEGETKNLLEMGAVHTEPVAGFFGAKWFEFLAAFRRWPLGHCAERHLIYASFIFKIDAIPTGFIQQRLNL